MFFFENIYVTKLTRYYMATKNVDLDAIFSALGDKNRRLLLDALKEKDGMTLSQLESVLGSMTRFGVMKHLKVLESASLITTRRHGRHKYHYLNSHPLRHATRQWLSCYVAA